MTKSHWRIGVVGIGSIGFRHARLLSRRSDVELYLCDTIPANLEAAKDLANLCETTDSYARLLAWPLDGVVIATPNSLHVDQACAACRRGIPVLLEKPIATSVADGEVLLAVTRETGAPVLVGYALHYPEFMRLAKKLLGDGVIGNPVSFQVMLGAYDTLIFAKQRFSPRDRDQLYFDYSHEWDYINWFLGHTKAVVASSHTYEHLEHVQNPNVVDAILELESGVTGTAHLDYVQVPTQRRCCIIGDKGTLDIDASQSLVTVHINGEDFIRRFQRIEHRDVFMERQSEHFLQVIAGAEQPLVSVDEGLEAIRVAEALVASSASRQWRNVQREAVQ